MWKNIAGIVALVIAGLFAAGSCWLMLEKGREKSGKPRRKKSLTRPG